MLKNLELYGEKNKVEFWAEEYGIPASLIRLRKKAGWTNEQAILTPMPFKPDAIANHYRLLRIRADFRGKHVGRKVYHFNGKSLTIAEWSEQLGVSAATLYNRLRQGWPLNKVFCSTRYSPSGQNRTFQL